MTALVIARGMSNPSEVVRSNRTKRWRLWRNPAPGTKANCVVVPAPKGQNYMLSRVP